MRNNPITKDIFSPLFDFNKEFERLLNFGEIENYSNIKNFCLEISEDENNYYVEADLPGVNKDSIHINLKDGNLVIEAERQYKEEKKERKFYRLEQSYGKFVRSIPMPENANVENITAELKEGILLLNIPKLAPKQEVVKKIEIK